MSEFDEYIVHGEPELRAKAHAWQTAIGLLDVDGLLVGANLPKTEDQSAISNDSKSKICTLNCTLEETAVLRCIETNPKMTQKEMAATIGKSERTVKSITSALVEKDIIIRKNGRRNGWWEISNMNHE